MSKKSSMSFDQFSNVRTNLDADIEKAKPLETVYLTHILTFLKEEIGCQAFDELDIIIVFYDIKQYIPEFNENKKGLYIILDEHATFHAGLCKKESLIFQLYGAESKYSTGKVFPFPLGYNGTLKFTPIKPIASRKNNVFFSGNLHKGRREFYNYYGAFKHLPFFLQHRLQSLTKIKYHHKYPFSFFQFTNGFSSGLSLVDYEKIISDSKIVLAPPGSVSVECFRHYEAMKQGCIVISEKLPDNYIFRGSPIIQINNWKEGDEVISYLLYNGKEMESIHRATLKWWNEIMSEQAVAKYIAEKIRTISSSRI